MEITLQEYPALTTEQQLDMLSDMGTRLLKRRTEEHQVTFYKLFDVFVKLYFHSQQTVITNIVMFKGIPIPEAYFDDVELSPSWMLHVVHPETTKVFKNISLPRHNKR